MNDEIGTVVSWPRLAEHLRRSAEIPWLELRGSWDNRPPMATPQHGAFLLVHLPARQWLLEQPVGTTRLVGDTEVQATISGGDVRIHTGDAGWVQEAAGMVAAPTSWFGNDDEIEVVEIPGRETVAGRSCSRFLVKYSRHSQRRMMLWLDDEWPLVLAARSVDQEHREQARFEMAVTEVRMATGSRVSRCAQIVADTLQAGAALLAR